VRCAAILAGGASLRMGVDKATIATAGSTWLERTARAARAAGAQVLIVGRSGAAGLAIDGARFVPDALPGHGPIGGLATALAEAPADHVAAVACDMPNVSAAAFAWLFAEAESRALDDGLVTAHAAGVEPLFAVYTTRCRPLVARRIAEGRRSLRGLVEAGRFVRVDAPPSILEAIVNVNTKEELAAYREARAAHERAAAS